MAMIHLTFDNIIHVSSIQPLSRSLRSNIDLHLPGFLLACTV